MHPTIARMMLAGSGPFIATGGSVADVGGYRIHTFTSGTNFTVISGSAEVEYLIIGSGGTGTGHTAGSGGIGSGGGAGDFVPGTLTVYPGVYPVIVGATAIGPASGTLSGNPSSVFGIEALGGGASYSGSGASGGGADGGTNQLGGIALGINGHNGGRSYAPNNYGAAGGGGAGGAGGNASGQNGGGGGAGVTSSFSGTSQNYCGGGGGSGVNSSGNGAYGGGSGRTSAGAGGNATTYGSGGGGSRNNNGSGGKGGNGGPGIVYIRYLIPV